MSIYLSGAIVMHRRAGYATVPVSRKREGEEGVGGGAGRRRRRALGFSFRVQLYRARQRGRGEGLNMHDAWALKPAFLRVVHHPRAPRMQIAGHRRYRFRHLERRSLPIPAKLRAREFFSLIFLPSPFFPILLLFFFLIVVLYLSIYLFFFQSFNSVPRIVFWQRTRKACSGGTAIWERGKGLGFFRAFEKSMGIARGKKGMQINISMNYDTNCSGVNFGGLNCGWNVGRALHGFYGLWKCLWKKLEMSGK